MEPLKRNFPSFLLRPRPLGGAAAPDFPTGAPAAPIQTFDRWIAEGRLLKGKDNLGFFSAAVSAGGA